MRRILCALVLFALPLGACGTAGGGRGGFSSTLAGPGYFALALFNDSAVKTLVLRNLVDRLQRFTVTPIGGGLPQDLDVPARGELRTPVGAFGFTNTDDGWLVVNTIDLFSMEAGFVEAYLHTERSGPDRESVYAGLLQSSESVIPVHPETDRVRLLNFGGVGATTYRVRAFGASDTVTSPELFNMLLPPMAPDSFVDLNGALAAIQAQFDMGHISVTPEVPAAPLPLDHGFTLAAHQDGGLVVEVDDRDEGRNDVSRLLDTNGTLSAEFMVEFGRDPVTGGYEDFDLLVSNFTGTDASFTVQSIHDEFGTPIKTTPQTFVMPARQSRLFATTVVDSRGLQLGEVHPFAHAFVDVFVAADRRFVRMNLSIDPRLFLSGRVFDPLALEFATGVRPAAIRRTTSVLTSDLQSSVAAGISNWAFLSNPSANPITVNVRAFTVTNGTEYQLPPIVVDPFGIRRFRADGLGLKEEPGVPVLADVPALRFLFSSSSPFGTRGRGESRDGAGLLIFVTPHIVRHEE